MARYSIMIREYNHDYETVLAQVDSNPMAVVEAARQRVRKQQVGAHIETVGRYDHVYAIDNETGEIIR